MRSTGFGKERVLENLVRVERFLGHLEQRQTEQHINNAIKELLLASRSVIDSVIDTLEEEQSTPTARKINISQE
jgi:hypothetical protein